jgi:hypothetical protein
MQSRNTPSDLCEMYGDLGGVLYAPAQARAPLANAVPVPAN